MGFWLVILVNANGVGIALVPTSTHGNLTLPVSMLGMLQFRDTRFPRISPV
jgi:hypothetical protein